MKYTVAICFFIALIVLIIGFYNIQCHKKLLWSQPSKQHLENTINNAYYFRKLNKYDLIARHVNSQEEYIAKYKNALRQFSALEQDKLNALIIKASQYTYKYEKLHKIPWMLVKFEGVENDFPHTIGNIIFLPQKFFLNDIKSQIETLIHEKVHLFQRLYSIETAELIEKLGFEVWGPPPPNIRTNPDTNSFLYSLEGTVQVHVYNSEMPQNIMDAHTTMLVGEKRWDVPESVGQRDHPYEIMACAIAQLLVGSLSDHPMKNKIIQSLAL